MWFILLQYLRYYCKKNIHHNSLSSPEFFFIRERNFCCPFWDGFFGNAAKWERCFVGGRPAGVSSRPRGAGSPKGCTPGAAKLQLIVGPPPTCNSCPYSPLGIAPSYICICIYAAASPSKASSSSTPHFINIISQGGGRSVAVAKVSSASEDHPAAQFCHQAHRCWRPWQKQFSELHTQPLRQEDWCPSVSNK